MKVECLVGKLVASMVRLLVENLDVLMVVLSVRQMAEKMVESLVEKMVSPMAGSWVAERVAHLVDSRVELSAIPLADLRDVTKADLSAASLVDRSEWMVMTSVENLAACLAAYLVD